MKKIDAYWDSKTLNINTFEITLEENDTISDLRDASREILNKRVYCVAKVPSARFDLYSALQEMGFTFNECQMSMKIQRKGFKQVQRSLGNFMEPVEFRRLTSEIVKQLIEEMKLGLFNTDRIALQPEFGAELANLRYSNWIQNSLSNPDYLVEETLYNGLPIGFGMFRLSKPRVTGLLGAVYPNAKEEGQFINGMYKTLERFFDEGYTVFEAKISSNNLPVIQVYLALGAVITEMSYVFSVLKA